MRLLRAKEEVKRAFDITQEQMVQISKCFCTEMDTKPGLGSLKMLDCPIWLPKGDENGTYLALDLGGTLVRALLVKLDGKGQYSVLAKSATRIWDEHFTGDTYLDAGELFNKLAELVAGILPNSSSCAYSLGFTFSYPVLQTSINRAKLIKWAKEISVPAMEGQDVGEALQAALLRRNLNVKVSTITNDTISTLLAGAYAYREMDLGSIVGTGHNTCFVRRADGPEAHVINIESGNFNILPLTWLDQRLDSLTASPGEQCLEKMVAGRYQGELFRLAMLELVREAGLLSGLDYAAVQSPFCITAEDMGWILADNQVNLTGVKKWVSTKLKVCDSRFEELVTLRELAAGISFRAARLVAATYGGILLNIDPGLDSSHGIALDGSICHKLPGFADNLRSALVELLNPKAKQVSILTVVDGSGIGAAVAAATSYR